MRKFLEVKRFAEVTQLVSTTWAHILSYSKALLFYQNLKKKKKTFKFIFNGQNILSHIVPSLSLPVPILMLFEYC